MPMAETCDHPMTVNKWSEKRRHLRVKVRRTVCRPCCHQQNSGKTGAFKSHDIGAEFRYVFLFRGKPDSAMRRNAQRSPPVAGDVTLCFLSHPHGPTEPWPQGTCGQAFWEFELPTLRGNEAHGLGSDSHKDTWLANQPTIKSKDLLCSCEERKKEGDASWGAGNPLIYHYFINQPPHSPR